MDSTRLSKYRVKKSTINKWNGEVEEKFYVQYQSWLYGWRAVNIYNEGGLPNFIPFGTYLTFIFCGVLFLTSLILFFFFSLQWGIILFSSSILIFYFASRYLVKYHTEPLKDKKGAMSLIDRRIKYLQDKQIRKINQVLIDRRIKQKNYPDEFIYPDLKVERLHKLKKLKKFRLFR